MTKEMKEAFRLSLPISFGYVFLAIAFALLMRESGFSFLPITLASIIVYAGSMQFALVGLLSLATPLWMIGLMTLVINFRMLFYGINFIEDYKKMGWKAPYMMFALTDETFSIFLGMKQSNKKYSQETYIWVAVFNHLYWISGTIIGYFVGDYIGFSTKGIEFSMTALFVVIVINQMSQAASYFPFIIGGLSGIISLIVFGPTYFLLPSLIATIILLFVVEESRRISDSRLKGGKGHD